MTRVSWHVVDRVVGGVCAILAGVTVSLGIISLVTLCSGCAVRHAQGGVQAGLTSAAEGVQAGADVVAAHVPEAVEGEGVEAYRERAAAFYTASRAYAATSEALLGLQAALDVWITSGDLPDGWPALCEAAGDAVGHFLEALEGAGLDVPEMLDMAPAAIETACLLTASFVEGDAP